MHLLTIVVSVIFSCFSTAILGYISLATPLGPWIAPTLALLAWMLLFVALRFGLIRSWAAELAVYSTIAGSVGGILATAVCWTVPTLFFVNPKLWGVMTGQPIIFVLGVAALSMGGGSLALMLSIIWHDRFIEQTKLKFPIAHVIHKTIALGAGLRSSVQLLCGFVFATIILTLQRVKLFGLTFIPSTIRVLPAALGRYAAIRFDVAPLLVSIGFIAGKLVALPMLVGVISKIVILHYLSTVWFTSLSSSECAFAFCSGIVIFGFCSSLPMLVKMLVRGVRACRLRVQRKGCAIKPVASGSKSIPSIAAISILVGFLLWFKFNVLAIVFVLVGAIACAYQLAMITGRIGLAPLGRFATFVMVPGILFFGFTGVQAIVAAAVVELVGGTLCDFLVGQRVVFLMGLNVWHARCYQMLGLVVSSLTIGWVVLILSHRFGLGSDLLFAQRAQARALLITAQSFVWSVVGLGVLFGAFLRIIRVNTMLVLSGLLMPVDYSLMLIAGGLLSCLTKDRRLYEPFWSGMFVSNSLWMLLRALL
ncbi:hypothetical protein HOL34_02645 [bacterium]|jgi:hypothetical protein|nr:hypothetical protein [bacterium]MBT3903384.1 hypothetical protein [bacterium]MBT4577673.1 hypothetical protein [bacterium]MBT5345851.1 hypothetical protein [bacterium]MBT6130830.1 hypothetical protein [bacterium]